MNDHAASGESLLDVDKRHLIHPLHHPKEEAKARWFALGHRDVEPDLVSSAKGVTSGYLPLGGVIVSKRMHQAIEDAPTDERFMHAATHSA